MEIFVFGTLNSVSQVLERHLQHMLSSQHNTKQVPLKLGRGSFQLWLKLTWLITADGDCKHEIKRHLPLGGKAMTNLDSILKSRDITLLTKVRLVKATVFLVVMYGCESWTIKKAECWRIDAFELWCWRRLLRIPRTARRSNQSILKEISPGCSLEGLMLKLKLQYFGYLMQRTDSLEKTLMLGKLEGRRRRGHRGWDGFMTSLTQWTWVWACSRSWWWTGKPGMLQSVGSQRDTTEQLNWTKPPPHCVISWVCWFLFNDNSVESKIFQTWNFTWFYYNVTL